MISGATTAPGARLLRASNRPLYSSVSGGERLGTFGGEVTLTSTCGSAMTRRTHDMISSGSSPASTRQSISATASGGMTLRFSLPLSMFTAKVVLTSAAWWRFAKKRARRALGLQETCEGPDQPVRGRVGPRHRSVPRLAPRGEAEGEARLLGDDDGAEGRAPAVRGLDHAELGERVLRAVEPRSALVGHPLGAEPAPHLLVRRPEEDQIPLERGAGPLDGEHGRASCR